MLLAALLSNGSVGVDRLRDLGPAPLLTAVLVFALLCVGSIPVTLAFGRRPLRETEIIVVTEEIVVAPVVVDLPVMAVAEESAMTPSSVLDQSNTQVIILPTTTETPHE